MKSYLKKAQEKFAQEKLASKNSSSEEDPHAGLVRTKKTTGRMVLDGNMLSKPIPLVPLNVVSTTTSTTDPAEASIVKKDTKEDPVNLSSKKRKIDEGEVAWSDVLAEFDGDGDVKLLWDKHFPVKNYVRERLLTEDDMNQIESLGLEQPRVSLQSLTLKATSLGHVIGDEFRNVKAGKSSKLPKRVLQVNKNW